MFPGVFENNDAINEKFIYVDLTPIFVTLN